MKRITTFLFSAIFALFLLPSVSSAQTGSQPGYYRMSIGDAEVIALSDGTITLDMNALLFNAKPEEISNLFQQNFLSATKIETSITAYLIRTNNKLILIDAGSGVFMGPTLGKLTQSLINAGFQPEQIDAVLLSHLHPDHVGGLIANDKMVFPNATIYVNKSDTAFWLSGENTKKANANDKFFFDAAQKSIAPYLKAGKVKSFDDGTSLFPGLTTMATPGHSAGHTSYVFDSNGEKIVFWGDLIHAGAVQFEDPAVTIHFDSDAKKAAEERKQAFKEAAKTKYWVAAPHLSFPGIGHVRANGSSYTWVPVNYSTITAK
jgi:glyoxylase-like metal-dependent hydrolase (beta-lactamase superfamily II)